LIEIEHVLVVGGILFSIGLYVALSRRNGVGILMGVELMLNAVNVNLIGFARLTESPSPVTGQVFSVFVITVAAAEAAVGLGIILAFYRNKDTLNIDEMTLMKW
jgi:NADH:ubiquinone oxidoreductase subunit K